MPAASPILASLIMLKFYFPEKFVSIWGILDGRISVFAQVL
jgi:hypothetical protein